MRELDGGLDDSELDTIGDEKDCVVFDYELNTGHHLQSFISAMLQS